MTAMQWMIRTLRQAFLIALIALVPATVSGLVQLKWRKEEPLEPGEVRAATVRLWADRVTFVDARPLQRYRAGHLPGAIPLNADQWDVQIERFLNEWDPEKTIVVYCDGGECTDSHAIAAKLRDEMQIPNVYVLKGGWVAWQSH